jgi:two-component system, chemotaxis family, CheB/CheR fusion protein
VGVAAYNDYADHLEANPEEFAHLFNTILINVTSFFRDTEAWEYLSAEIVPRVISQVGSNGSIRVWSAGCASGQEAYSLAIALAERLGIEQFRRRVKIYASDVDEEALGQARHATYGPGQVQDLPPELLTRYFERIEDRYVFHKDLRRAIIFGRHDLVQDAPISRVHLLTCRNTLMYFNRETQGRVLARFHFALRPGGVLFMGKAEMLLTHGHLFTPVELKWRVFTKVAAASEVRDHLPLPRLEEPGDDMDSQLQALALDSDMTAQFVIRADGLLVLANERARALFRLTGADIGRRVSELDLSYRPTELRSRIDEAMTTRRPVTVRDVVMPSESGELRFLDLHLVPLIDDSGRGLGTKVTLADVTRYKKLQEELEHSRHELETAYEELQSSNEELETTNEELQSTNEELETTNEELQSTNEELETMNEELQSTNEELETTNGEMGRRGEDLRRINALLESILSGLEVGVVVVDPDLRVIAWNNRAEDLWGLRADEVRNRHILNLDIGLPVEQLRMPIRASLAGERNTSLVLDATNRRGRSIRCKISSTPLASGDGDTHGVILLMEELAPPA